METTVYTLGASVIGALVTVVIFLFKKWDSEREKRLKDIIEFKDKSDELLKQSTEINEKLVNAVPTNRRTK